ncbi:hypothetical protein EIN_023650 [Entamoeba invadens IP1]|uniref:hypothetical protein n=1 Tax=Entamoeba invadens IP1 TaxID=370355 RepID=UPI0002C3E7BD|nr:hypothetical protein EIN_023650 [Entamoeba invadens IP1]ELP90676.1 hypothetical protein EIN_023650 [Entamoeba invadens IP1]|eukprot:XP_004257447.1 hypothetical protein EIN_023650 [Entamoeba invadens IP1]
MSTNDEACQTTRRLLKNFDTPPSGDGNTQDNNKILLASICEYLIDQDIPCDLFDQLIRAKALFDFDIPQTLHNKRNLLHVMDFMESITPPYCDLSMFPSAISLVIQMYYTDPKAKVIESVPSLIGILGMICSFHLFVTSHVDSNFLFKQLNILLPSASELPFVTPSRKTCLNATNSLLKASPKDEYMDVPKYLQNIQEVQYLLSRYPLDRTVDHIKMLLQNYRNTMGSSLVFDTYTSYLNGQILGKQFEWPSSDFTTIREMQIALQLDCQTFKNIVLGEDPKVKEFLKSRGLVTATENHFLVTQEKLQEKTDTKVRCEKEEKKEKKLKTPQPSSKGEDDENKQKKKKRRFSEEETQNLIAGVEQFGVGHWKSILSAYEFDGRSCVDLKDKWRNIENSKNRNKPQKSATTPTNTKENSTKGTSFLPIFNY